MNVSTAVLCGSISIAKITFKCTFNLIKECTKPDLPAELGFRLNGNSSVNLTVLPVYTDRMRRVYKYYKLYTFVAA